MGTSRPVRALVPMLKVRKRLVRGFGKLLWELGISLAGVDEQRRFALLEVGLQRMVSGYTATSLDGAHRGPWVGAKTGG